MVVYYMKGSFKWLKFPRYKLWLCRIAEHIPKSIVQSEKVLIKCLLPHQKKRKEQRVKPSKWPTFHCIQHVMTTIYTWTWFIVVFFYCCAAREDIFISFSFSLFEIFIVLLNYRRHCKLNSAALLCWVKFNNAVQN